MRTTSILLALVVVLSASEASAWAPVFVPEHDYTISAGGQMFGFRDGTWVGDFDPANYPQTISYLHLGPVGQFEVPFAATQGLVGFCVVLALLVIVPAVLTVRWKRKRAGI
jgi:hypothetical protein